MYVKYNAGSTPGVIVDQKYTSWRGVLLIPGTGNGERGTGNRERESGNECTAVIRIRIQNGGRNHGKGSGN